MLVLYIKQYEKKIGRLKFERKLLLNSLNTQKHTPRPKRLRQDTTDSVRFYHVIFLILLAGNRSVCGK